MSEELLVTLSDGVRAFFGDSTADRSQQQRVLDRTSDEVRSELMAVIHHFEWLQPWFEPNEMAAAKLVRESFETRFPNLTREALDALGQSATIKRN
jgi:hypothetical protein